MGDVSFTFFCSFFLFIYIYIFLIMLGYLGTTHFMFVKKQSLWERIPIRYDMLRTLLKADSYDRVCQEARL